MTIKETEDGRLVVTRVAPHGNAAAAGVRQGDIVVELGGITATSAEEFTEIEKIMSPGDQLEITVRRGLAEPKKIMLQWGTAPKPDQALLPNDDQPIGSGVASKRRQGSPRGADFVPHFEKPPAADRATQHRARNVPAQTASKRLTRPSDSEILELRSIVVDQQKLIRELQAEIEQLRRAVRQRSSRR